MVKHGVFNLADRFRGFTVSILEGFGSFHQKKSFKNHKEKQKFLILHQKPPSNSLSDRKHSLTLFAYYLLVVFLS